jgi:hypothetical protein
MRLTAEATCLSWIPREAVEGAFKLPFGWGVAHYDKPPPDASPDVDGLLCADAIRFANQLRAWVDVEDGRIAGHGMTGGGRLGSTTVRLKKTGVTFAGVALPDLAEPPELSPDRVIFRQTCGGHTGAPVPRAVPHLPFVRIGAPIAWSTIVLTLHADGSSESEIADASVFPRHYLYDSSGRLTHKSALIRYKDWLLRSERQESPWAGVRHTVPTAGVKAEAERSLADTILVSGHYDQRRLRAGIMLDELHLGDDQVAVLLDGLLDILIDGEPAVELGPGAILDPSKRSGESRQHASIRAQTDARFAVLSREQLDGDALLDVASEQASALRALLARRQTPERRDQATPTPTSPS